MPVLGLNGCPRPVPCCSCLTRCTVPRFLHPPHYVWCILCCKNSSCVPSLTGPSIPFSLLLTCWLLYLICSSMSFIPGGSNLRLILRLLTLVLRGAGGGSREERAGSRCSLMKSVLGLGEPVLWSFAIAIGHAGPLWLCWGLMRWEALGSTQLNHHVWSGEHRVSYLRKILTVE